MKQEPTGVSSDFALNARPLVPVGCLKRFCDLLKNRSLSMLKDVQHDGNTHIFQFNNKKWSANMLTILKH